MVELDSIRTKDPNNHSDTETGTLSTDVGPIKVLHVSDAIILSFSWHIWSQGGGGEGWGLCKKFPLQSEFFQFPLPAA